jgi:hypothetical protein
MRELTHRNAQERNGDLYGRYNVHRDLNAGAFGDPIESIECQDETEEILEDNHHGKALDSKVA